MKKILFFFTIIYSMLFLTGCASYGTGIEPIYPPGKTYIPAPKVDSLTPTLAWKPFKEDGIENLRYDLIIFTRGGFPPKSKSAYEKANITDTSHKLEKPLDPRTQYFWRVRAKYSKNGTEVTGKWNGFSTIAINGFSTGKPYFFATPNIDN